MGLGALLAFGCLLRFWKLGEDGLWYDELWTVVGASDRSFMDMYRGWMLGDAHPPGYFLFYFVWFELFPNDELWARLPNAIAGVLTVAYLLFGTRRVLSRDERIFAAALASLSSLYLFYAVNVKQYSAVILLATVATVTYARIAEERVVERRTAHLFTATLVGLAWLNHFAMAYAWVLLGLLALAFRADRELLRSVGRMAGVLAVTYLPIAYFLYFPFLLSNISQPSEVSTLLSGLLPALFFDDRTVVRSALAILGATLAWRATRDRRTRSELRSDRNRHLATLVATFALLLAALSVAEPTLVVRYFIVLFPSALLAVAILAAAAFPLSRGWWAALPLLFFARAAVVDFRMIDGMQRQEWDVSVDLVLASARPGDPIYVLGSSPERSLLDYLRAGDIDGGLYRQNLAFYEYYFRRRGADGIAADLEVVEPTAAAAARLARELRGTGRTAYILAGHHIQLDDEAVWNLEQAARRMETTWLYSTILYQVEF